MLAPPDGDDRQPEQWRSHQPRRRVGQRAIAEDGVPQADVEAGCAGRQRRQVAEALGHLAADGKRQLEVIGVDERGGRGRRLWPQHMDRHGIGDREPIVGHAGGANVERPRLVIGTRGRVAARERRRRESTDDGAVLFCFPDVDLGAIASSELHLLIACECDVGLDDLLASHHVAHDDRLSSVSPRQPTHRSSRSPIAKRMSAGGGSTSWRTFPGSGSRTFGHRRRSRPRCRACPRQSSWLRWGTRTRR